MEPINPTFDHFEELAARFNSVPLVATLICDDMTPLSAFARLQADSPRAFLLESVVGGENVARYSFLGADPAWTFETIRERVRWIDNHNGQQGVEKGDCHTYEQESDDPLALLEQTLKRYRAPVLPGLPRFVGGAVGYAAYDTVRYYERLPSAPADDRGLPDLLFDIYETMIVFDHVHKIVLVVAHANVPDNANATQRRAAYEAAAGRIEELVERLERPSVLRPTRITLPAPATERYTSNFEQAAFEQVVDRCKEYIRAGDIFQVVPSQRLLVETAADPLNIYRALRVINPSPFMFYLKSPQVVLVGASPEVMCRVEDGVVTNRPLAGTRRRGRTEEEDRRLREELLADPKERAEHVMLVDLGRNDVGRVSKPNTVRLSDVMTVEYYSHVMHISSTVTGELADGKTAFDALRATLPVGTVSGAPKVRALEIIDECEPTRRGPYAGAVGYVDFAGNMDTCIALRTLVAQPTGGGQYKAYVQVGAGIVADSVPEREYQETLNKAQSLLSAIRTAEERFGEAGTAVLT
ncbi:MAG: anthranilate synthase component I [Phycisphaerae bacterium]|nr:anthranilate synthase component I [Phycisphaerae bacterium]